MHNQVEYESRLWILVALLVLLSCSILARIVYLGVVEHHFLMDQSNMRSVREVKVPAHRGIITDRNGEPLAISIPVAAIWINPKIFNPKDVELKTLAKMLNLPSSVIQARVRKSAKKEFVYLKRAVSMELAKRVLDLHINGIFLERSYKRYYPEGASAAHVIGFTNIDDVGQEGLELAYDSWLRGVPGKMRVVKDRLGNTVANVAVLSQPKEGHDLVLSIDRRIQYLAYSELKKAIQEYSADSGSVVVLAAKTGEVLAMVNMPSYDPNDRKGVALNSLRNRAATDLFEPGSTIKAFTIAAALNSGKYRPTSIIDTNPGVLRIEGHAIYDNDHKNHGTLTVKGVLQKSSDIGVAKMALSLPSDTLPRLFHRVGFAQRTESGFPGEASGFMPTSLRGRQLVLATLSFGYSISVTALQLAKAYATVAAKGVARPVTFLKRQRPAVGQNVLSKKTCQELVEMLEAVIDIGGTGTRAQIPGYKVAGKTGTAHVASPHGGYYADRYFANFIGLAPVSDPELVIVVVVKNPQGGYHGGRVAAPIFANIMNGALRILGIKLDAATHL